VVFVVEAYCVFCEVGAEFLAAMLMNFSLQKVKRLKYRTTKFSLNIVIRGEGGLHVRSMHVRMFLHMKDDCAHVLTCV
jgi:hypothetical protein